MAYIKILKDNELLRGTDNTDVYPVTTTQAVFSQKADGSRPDEAGRQRLEDRLEGMESDIKELQDESGCDCASLCKEDLDEIISGAYSAPVTDWCEEHQ